MNTDMEYDTGKYTLRWVSYFDLLGIKDLINKNDWFSVMSVYNHAIEKCKEVPNLIQNIGKTWFSDTFLIYTLDNSDTSFTQIDLSTRWFVYFLILAGIPVRGALAYGDFYADEKNNIFFGPAFVEAYKYGESQDWIGYILAPSAEKQMENMGLPASDRLDYAYWKIPYKKTSSDMSKDTLTLRESLPAYVIGDHIRIGNKNLCLQKLYEMKDSLKNENYVTKYLNTIEFIESNKRDFSKPNTIKN